MRHDSNLWQRLKRLEARRKHEDIQIHLCFGDECFISPDGEQLTEEEYCRRYPDVKIIHLSFDDIDGSEWDDAKEE